MDILNRFRLALKFAVVPGDYVLRFAASILTDIHDTVGDAFDLLTEADLQRIDPKKLPELARALFAFWMTTQGLDEMQVKVSVQLLEAELRRMFPFLNEAGPRI